MAPCASSSTSFAFPCEPPQVSREPGRQATSLAMIASPCVLEHRSKSAAWTFLSPSPRILEVPRDDVPWSWENRCGKFTARVLARVCFNASSVTAHPKEAQLSQAASRTRDAQLFDEVE